MSTSTLNGIEPLAGITALHLISCSDEAKNVKPAEATVQVSVLNWGPQVTKAGTGFSMQANGNSALWFEQRGIPHAGAAELWLDKTALPGVIITPNEAGSAEVPPTLISKPGKYPVYVIFRPQNQRVELGTFEVLP